MLELFVRKKQTCLDKSNYPISPLILDLLGSCGDGKYPLLKSMNKVLAGEFTYIKYRQPTSDQQQITAIQRPNSHLTPRNTYKPASSQPPAPPQQPPLSKAPTTTIEKTVSEDECAMGDGPNRFPDNCSFFYNCAHGVPYVVRCPLGLHFNPDLRLCDWSGPMRCYKE